MSVLDLVLLSHGIIIGALAFDLFNRSMISKKMQSSEKEIRETQKGLSELHNKNADIMAKMANRLEAVELRASTMSMKGSLNKKF